MTEYDDPTGLRTYWRAPPDELNKEMDESEDTTKVPTTPLASREWAAEDANLISSLTILNRHLPVLDLDFECRLVPSSRKGHYHLYLDGITGEDGMIGLTWEDYEKFLVACKEARVIGPGWLHHSQQRRMTVVRRPHILKPPPPVSDDEPF